MLIASQQPDFETQSDDPKKTSMILPLKLPPEKGGAVRLSVPDPNDRNTSRIEWHSYDIEYRKRALPHIDLYIYPQDIICFDTMTQNGNTIAYAEIRLTANGCVRCYQERGLGPVASFEIPEIEIERGADKAAIDTAEHKVIGIDDPRFVQSIVIQQIIDATVSVASEDYVNLDEQKHIARLYPGSIPKHGKFGMTVGIKKEYAVISPEDIVAQGIDDKNRPYIEVRTTDDNQIRYHTSSDFECSTIYAQFALNDSTERHIHNHLNFEQMKQRKKGIENVQKGSKCLIIEHIDYLSDTDLTAYVITDVWWDASESKIAARTVPVYHINPSDVKAGSKEHHIGGFIIVSRSEKLENPINLHLLEAYLYQFQRERFLEQLRIYFRTNKIVSAGFSDSPDNPHYSSVTNELPGQV